MSTTRALNIFALTLVALAIGAIVSRNAPPHTSGHR
jgi:hypothetical protein